VALLEVTHHAVQTEMAPTPYLSWHSRPPALIHAWRYACRAL